jgi:DUF4097 and DUF4098 domain-containing protein YvlB
MAAVIIQDPKIILTTNRIEPLPYCSNLIVTNTIGTVHVRGWDNEQINIDARIEGESVDGIIVEVNKLLGGIEVFVKGNRTRRLLGLLPTRAAKCDLNLSVPRLVLANIKILDGLIDITGIKGLVKCEAVNGEIKLLNISGKVNAKTINGAISITKLAPGIWPGQVGGTTEPVKTFDGLKAESANGNIKLEDILGSVKVNTIYGQIQTKRMDAKGDGISLETISGNINVELVRPSTEITAETVVGSIDVKLPNSKVVEESKTRNVVFVQGRLPHAQKISIKTVNGAITVR